MSQGTRCPNCDATVAPDAEWCWQCFTSIEKEPAPAPAADPAAKPADRAKDGADPAPAAGSGAANADTKKEESESTLPVWACPVCDHENPLSRDVCEVCGSPFGKLFDEPKVSKDVDPSSVLRAALVPGLGHMKVGMGAEGLVRMLVFVGAIGFALVFVGGCSGIAAHLLTLIFLLSAVLLYAESVYDAHRLAQGRDQILTAKLILYIFMGLFGLAVVIVMGFSLTAPKIVASHPAASPSCG